MGENWTKIINTSNDINLLDIIDNYTTKTNGKFNLNTNLAPRNDQEKNQIEKAKAQKVFNHRAKTVGGGIIGGSIGGGIGYAFVFAGPVGWGLAAIVGVSTVISGAATYYITDEAEYNKLVNATKTTMGFAGSIFSQEISELYQREVLKPLIRTAETLMVTNATSSANRENYCLDREDIINSIGMMLNKDDAIFTREKNSLGHMQFITSVKKLKSIMSDLMSVYNGEDIVPKGMSSKLYNQFKEFSKAEQKQYIEGIFNLFVMTLSVTKEALEKNTKLDALEVLPKEQCQII